MKFSLWLASALGSLALSTVVVARPLTVEEKHADIEQLGSIIRSQYAPLKLKEEKLGLKLDKLLADYSKASDKLSNGEFYYLINQLVAEFQDGHFKSSIKTDHKSTLGFVTDLVQGKIVIETVDRSLIPQYALPLMRGDEVISIDGVKAVDVAKDLEKYVGAGNPKSRKRLAAFLVTSRATSNVPAKTGNSVVVIASQAVKKTIEVELPWVESGTPLDAVEREWSGDDEVRKSPMDYQTLGIDDALADYPKLERGFMCNTLSRFNPPTDAVPIMTSPFVAYTFDTPKGKIGYLRVPHFNWGKDAAARLKNYEYAIHKLESSTEGLILDSSHNCGGTVSVMEDLLKMFATKPFEGLKFQFLASRNEINEVKKWVSDQEYKASLESEGLTAILNAINLAWKKGDRLTSLTSWNEGRLLQPASIRYTKPLIVLTDELSGSAGDGFPALLQGMGRGPIIGQTTMGAGGHVVTGPTLNNSGNTITLTKSLFYHPNGKAIEGAGVTPDFTYETTLEDYTTGYRPYQKFYMAKLFEKIDEAKGIKPTPSPSQGPTTLQLAAVLGGAVLR